MRVYHDIFATRTDPDQLFLKWIRIRPNDTDPTGSETLMFTIQNPFLLYSDVRAAGREGRQRRLHRPPDRPEL